MRNGRGLYASGTTGPHAGSDASTGYGSAGSKLAGLVAGGGSTNGSRYHGLGTRPGSGSANAGS
jgi:hypothetical protein